MALTRAQIDDLKRHEGQADTPQATSSFLSYVIEHYPKDVAVISSFGAESIVLLENIARIDRYIPVYFLDTGRHFPQTLAYRDEVVRFLDLKHPRILRPDPKIVSYEDPDGLMATIDPDRCCELRKVRPLEKVEPQFDIWITGRKRGQSKTRRYLPIVEEVSQGRVKINPLAGWNAQQLQHYMKEKGLPEHPLVREGYPSIGCAPCTRPVAQGEDSRSGRWAGQKKTECGLHRSFATKTAE